MASGLIIFVILGLLAFVTLKEGKLPELGGATLFVTGSVGALYGTNKIANAIENKAE